MSKKTGIEGGGVRGAGDSVESSIEKEKPEFERLRKIVFWSFYVSQGEPRLQFTILSNVVRMHPELIHDMRSWAAILKFSKDKTADTTQADASLEPEEMNWSVDQETLLKEPSGARLLRDVRRFVSGHLHPEGSLPETGTEEFTKEVLSETALRVADLFKTLLLAERKGEEEEALVFESLENCANELIYRDSDRLSVYSDLKKQTRDSSLSLEDRRFARRSVSMRKEIGVSIVCKYALSKDRHTATPRLAPEIQELLEAVGDYMRSHTTPWRKKRVYAKRSVEFILVTHEWKKATKEEISL